MVSTPATARPRPYWHVDAKWVVGLVLLLVWSATLFGFGLYRLTDEKVAVPLLTLFWRPRSAGRGWTARRT